jgi:flagellar motor protein MotB
MGIKYSQRVGPLSLFVILCIGMISCPQGMARNRIAASDKTMAEYKESMAAAASEIKIIKGDIEWLELKIKRMAAFDQEIPRKLVDAVKQKKAKIAALEKVRKTLENQLSHTLSQKRNKTRASLEKQLEKAGLIDWMEFSGDTIILTNRLPILFASGSAVIAPDYQDFLKKLAAFVKMHEVHIIVDGYADINPIRTLRYPSNLELGAARAANVVHELVKHGVNPAICQIGSTGEHRLDNRKISKWKVFERRVIIRIHFNPES